MFRDIIESSKWSESHGAEGGYLGMGLFYYGLPYALDADLCVCLGSGAGFVPKLMLKAQEELVKEGRIEKVNIALVDADIGPWGRPVYQDGIDGHPEIKRIKARTDEVYDQFSNIAYLHVDADHSYEAVLSDLNLYGTRMRPDRWAITVHDTYNGSDGDHPMIGAYQACIDWTFAMGYNMLNFPTGCGTAVIMPPTVNLSPVF